MELAIHLRNVEHACGLDRLHEHLSNFYETPFPQGIWSADDFDRIYIGDEFCPHRMPRLAELDALLDLSREHHKQVTLLTPPLTDCGIEKLSPLLNRIRDGFPAAEVVGNDWGVLIFLNEEFPGFALAAGRLLDKGFKDPRLSDAPAVSSLSEEMRDVLNSSSFDSSAIGEKLIELGVRRIERDMFPYRNSPPTPLPGLAMSLYLPYGYVTTGRVCWLSTFAEGGASKFAPLDECARPCDWASLKLEHSDMALPIFQSGNTVHYLQPQAALDMIFETAGRENVRLVYQGFAV